MALLSTNQTPMRWMNGDSDRIALFTLLNVTTGDTCDLAQWFAVVRRATMLGVTVAGAVAATVTGDTVVTIPTGVSKDAVVLTVYGVAAN
jgi:hypothetical protein